jgi:hypothetical protein
MGLAVLAPRRGDVCYVDSFVSKLFIFTQQISSKSQSLHPTSPVHKISLRGAYTGRMDISEYKDSTDQGCTSS